MKKMKKGPFRGPFVGLIVQTIMAVSRKAQGRRVSGSEALGFAASPDPRRPCALLRFEDPCPYANTPAVSCMRADTSPSWCRVSPKVMSSCVNFLK